MSYYKTYRIHITTNEESGRLFTVKEILIIKEITQTC